MLKSAAKNAPERWVFGRYIVFAPNRYVARRIYESALDRLDQSTRFGYIGLDDGSTGNWVLLPERKQSTPWPFSAF